MNNSKKCQLCSSDENDELKYGKLFISESLIVHQFCLLFAPNCPQNGDDDEGFDGFLPEDIKKEIKRVKLLKCCFCERRGANLGCNNEKHLSGAFHTGCAWKNNVSFEFTSSFTTYCKQHAEPKPEPNDKTICQICFQNFKLKNKKLRCILMPCCRNNWFHRDCLQKYAMTAGVFFKCPICGSKDNQEKLKKMGIFFPVRDALWELEPEAFSEFVQPLNLICEYENCSNRTYNKEKQYMWKLCAFCGANGVHIKCFNARENDPYTCLECKDALDKIKQIQLEAKYKRQRTWISDEEVLSSDDEETHSPQKKKNK